jgi:hypothetical protein
MPRRSKRSRTAKEKRDQTHAAAFSKRAAGLPSPDGSDYSAPESNQDMSTTEAECSDNSEAGDREISPMEEIQRLYSVFLPPHLQAKERTRQKRRKIANRRLVYTGDSRTTAWRKDTAQKKAAKGCATLDAFIMRRVSPSSLGWYQAISRAMLIVIRSGSVVFHRSRNLKEILR